MKERKVKEKGCQHAPKGYICLDCLYNGWFKKLPLWRKIWIKLTDPIAMARARRQVERLLKK